MDAHKIIHTQRLTVTPLHISDHELIVELLNTEGWIKFIGNRNIHSKEDAIAYIQKIDANPSIAYWTVKEKDTREGLGLVTLIQRDYLDQPDIGFAFLPAVMGRGYAYEAAKALLEHVLQDETVMRVHAVTLPGNNPSIRLCQRLGLVFDKEIVVGDERLHLYTFSKNKP